MKGEGIRRLLFALDFVWRAFWIPAPPVIPAKAGIQNVGEQPRHPKPSAERNRRIPSPFMGLLPYTFSAALNPVGNFSAHGIRRRFHNQF